MATARLVLLIGSGELGPVMSRAHRAVLDRLGDPGRCAFLDTPFAFQENAADLRAKAASYFERRLGRPLSVASLDGELGEERLSATLRRADYVFAGPGSPSYALRRWRDSLVPGLLAEKLATGGAVGFASAAALTLGAFTVPVYEIYKVGEEPRWLEGLGLLPAVGLRAAVIPHFDNAEGGTHDTRYCYLGERRLRLLEERLPEDVFVLGIDEHTYLLLDLDEDVATVGGRGTVTLRAAGHGDVLPSGKVLSVTELVERGSVAAAGTARTRRTTPRREAPAPEPAGWPQAGGAQPDLGAVTREAEDRVRLALGRGDAGSVVQALLDLESAIAVDPSPQGRQEDARREGGAGATQGRRVARAALRALVADLAPMLRSGIGDPVAPIRSYVDLLVELRERLRSAQGFELADEIRTRLGLLGIEIRDTPQGSSWQLATGAQATEG